MTSLDRGTDVPGTPQGAHLSATSIAGATALVTGASRGFGRDIAISLSQAGAQVVGVARDKDQLNQLRDALGDSFTPVTADAAGPATAGLLIDAYRPGILVLNAGAAPLASVLAARRGILHDRR